MGYSPWGRKESDRTERRHFHFFQRETCVIPRWGLVGGGTAKCQVWEDESPSQQRGLPDYRATRHMGTNLASALSSCCSHQTCTHPSPNLPLRTPPPPQPPTPTATLSPLRWQCLPLQLTLNYQALAAFNPLNLCLLLCTTSD